MGEVNKLRPANENPWYVLMTLYGEQTAEQIDTELHKKNRAAWNAWSCQNFDGKRKIELAFVTRTPPHELSNWTTERQAEIQTLHNQQMVSRNPEGFVYPGVPHVSVDIAMEGLSFSSRLVLDGMVFSENSSFNLSRFENEVRCLSTYFSGSVNIARASFEGEATLINTTFSSDIFLGYCRFAESARFADSKFLKTAIFSSSIFRKGVFFGGVQFFGEANFGSVVFEGVASFPSTHFEGLTWFGPAEDQKGIDSRSTRFEKSAEFDRAIFVDHVYFEKVEFSSADIKYQPSFANCIFMKPASFKEAKFYFQYPDFSRATLNTESTFTAKDDFWPVETKVKLISDAKESCAKIRHNVGKQGLSEDEHFFYRREMGFSSRMGGAAQRLPYLAYRIFSDFGYSIMRPTLWLIGIWALGVAAFWGYFLQRGVDGSFGTAFALSFSNIFPVFGFGRVYFESEFMRALPMALRVFSGIQTVIGLPIIFFLGLGLRQRFRLR